MKKKIKEKKSCKNGKNLIKLNSKKFKVCKIWLMKLKNQRNLKTKMKLGDIFRKCSKELLFTSQSQVIGIQYEN